MKKFKMRLILITLASILFLRACNNSGLVEVDSFPSTSVKAATGLYHSLNDVYYSLNQIKNELMQAINELYDNEACRRKLAYGAIKCAQEYSWGNKATKVQSIYRKIVEKKLR